MPWACCLGMLPACLPCQRVDALFIKEAGWSILHAIGTLTTDNMRDTSVAQPITFLVQVGPAHVTGHSRSVTAA